MLFRQQATDAVTDRLHGDVIALPRVSHVVVISSILIWVVLVCIWLINGTFPRRETAQGWLEPKGGIARIYAQNSSTVSAVLVTEGLHVRQGEPLLEIYDLNAFNGGQNINGLLQSEFDAQKHRIENQIIREKELKDIRKQRLHLNSSAARFERVLLREQQNTVTKKLHILKSRIKRLDSLLAQGLLAKNDFDVFTLEILSAENEVDTYALELFAKETHITDNAHQLNLLEKEHSNIIDQLNSQLSELTQSSTELSNRYVSTIRAPKSGVVTNLQVSAGQQLRANELLMTVGSGNAEYEVNLLVPVNAAGLLKKGQAMSVRYDSFPHEQYGLYEAKVVDVSTTILLLNELGSSPIQPQSPVYKVTAALDANTIKSNGQEIPLKQGMTLTADIKLENRSLIAWLFQPILSLRGRL